MQQIWLEEIGITVWLSQQTSLALRLFVTQDQLHMLEALSFLQHKPCPRARPNYPLFPTSCRYPQQVPSTLLKRQQGQSRLTHSVVFLWTTGRKKCSLTAVLVIKKKSACLWRSVKIAMCLQYKGKQERGKLGGGGSRAFQSRSHEGVMFALHFAFLLSAAWGASTSTTQKSGIMGSNAYWLCKKKHLGRNPKIIAVGVYLAPARWYSVRMQDQYYRLFQFFKNSWKIWSS